ncbi:lysosome-associated membrane glycoprotein 1a [Brachionichthys hirsutus]|uniref:lysosome-associated membrane glycoprotein 1a n=1 Tax=Brachionichthys hirsutus TaxID=412623 RepID=UPI0036043328
MERCHAFASLIFAWFSLFGCVQAVTLEVTEGNSTCIKAELSASFSIPYDTPSGAKTALVSLPDSATVDAGSSSCGSGGGPSRLVTAFGSGHALGLSFVANGSLYRVANLTLQYNLSDASVFPEANGSGVVAVASSSVGIWAPVNSSYRCVSSSTFAVGDAAVTFWNMRLEAYMPGSDLSPTESVCMADKASTTAPPTTAGTTTAAPPPTPAGKPQQGNYSVTDSNGTVCLLARMGLQLNVSYSSRSQNKTIRALVNVAPNATTPSGSCDATNATLILTGADATTLTLGFTLNATSNKYHLSAITLQADWSDMTAPIRAGNNSLDYMRSSLGRSYMCNAEQTLAVAPTFSLNTFRLQIQPFQVATDRFAAAEECQLDQDHMLIPIVVGAALAGLVLVVLIAYLIGRRRSHAGYQTI